MTDADFRPRFEEYEFDDAYEAMYSKREVDLKLDELFKGAKVVTGDEDQNGLEYWGPYSRGRDDSHIGIVCGIRPVEKKECEHEPTYSLGAFVRNDKGYTYELNVNSECKHCGVKLKANWVVAE